MMDFHSLNVKVWVWDKGKNQIYTKSNKLCSQTKHCFTVRIEP